MQKPSPSPDMTAKLNRIKSALRESIEIASKATEGPWYSDEAIEGNGSVVMAKLRVALCKRGKNTPNADCDATFISHARTMTPLVCKALLTAIEGLEMCAVYLPKGDDTAKDTLASITSEWPDV